MDALQSNLVLAPQKMAGLQDDLFNMIQQVIRDPSEFLQLKAAGNFYPTRIPVSSILGCFMYVIQIPLPLALNAKKAFLTK